jgi:hypothetical protein
MRTHKEITDDLTKYSKLIQISVLNEEWNKYLKIYNSIIDELNDYYKIYAICGNKKPCTCSECEDLKKRFPSSTSEI